MDTTSGADPTPVQPGTWPKPGQYIHRWNTMTEAERLAEAEAVLELKRAEYYRRIQPPHPTCAALDQSPTRMTACAFPAPATPTPMLSCVPSAAGRRPPR